MRAFPSPLMCLPPGKWVMDAKGQGEQDQPRDCPAAMLTKVQIPNPSCPSSNPNQWQPGKADVGWLGTSATGTHILTSVLHPRQSGSPILNHPTVKFINLHGFMIDKSPLCQSHPGSVWLKGCSQHTALGFLCELLL